MAHPLEVGQLAVIGILRDGLLVTLHAQMITHRDGMLERGLTVTASSDNERVGGCFAAAMLTML